MPNKRSPGQKGVLIMMDEAFRAEIDAALPHTEFEDRSSFIRDAVYQRLRELGVNVPRSIKAKPLRVGKSAKAESGIALVAETTGDHSPVSFHSTSPVPTPAHAKYPKAKPGRKKGDK